MFLRAMRSNLMFTRIASRKLTMIFNLQVLPIDQYNFSRRQTFLQRASAWSSQRPLSLTHPADTSSCPISGSRDNCQPHRVRRAECDQKARTHRKFRWHIDRHNNPRRDARRWTKPSRRVADPLSLLDQSPR